MDWRSFCSFSNSSCLGLYLASTCDDTFLSSSESIIAFWTLTTATLSWADATVARGARTKHSRPARMAIERNILLGLLSMETHRLAYPQPNSRGAWLRPCRRASLPGAVSVDGAADPGLHLILIKDRLHPANVRFHVDFGESFSRFHLCLPVFAFR